MTFLDLTEADKLAVVVVELHVDPRRQCDALGNSDQVFSPRPHELVLATN